MMGKKAALRVLQDFWSSLEEDWFEAQVLDCVAVILNYAPSLALGFNDEYIAFCKREKSYRLPARTAYGRQFLRACIALGLVDLRKPFLGGNLSWPVRLATAAVVLCGG